MALFPVAASGRTNSSATQEPETLPVAIGFAPFTDERATVDVVDARSLDAGDARFHASGVTLRLSGFTTYDAANGAGNIDRLLVDVAFTPFHDAQFHAWSFRNDPAASCSCPSSLTVPIDTEHGLNLVMSVQQNGEETPREIPVQLVTAHHDGASKLREGYYFVGFPDPDGVLPDWSDYVVRNEPGIPDLERLTPTAPGPVFMLSVGVPG